MVCMREHIDRLHGGHLVIHIEQLQVACLGCRVAAYIDNALGGCKENGVDDIVMHAGTWRVGDDDIGHAVLANEITGKDILHVTGKECEVIEAIELGVDARIDDGILDILHTHYLLGIACNKVGNCSGTGVEVIDYFVTCKGGKITRYLIKVLGLFAVCLVERFWANLEAQSLHLLIYNVSTLVGNDLEVAEGVVALVVDDIEQRGHLGERVGHIL